MWIVIEGPEGTGKTTAAKRIEALGWHYEHATIDDKLSVLERKMFWLAQSGKQDVVWDRAHLSEMVYASIRRGYKPDLGWFHAIESLLKIQQVNCYHLTHIVDDTPYDPDIDAAFRWSIATLSRLIWLDWDALAAFISREDHGRSVSGDREKGI